MIFPRGVILNTEDKQAWCDLGAEAEHSFCRGRLDDLGLLGVINPLKKENPYVHDLFISFKADLKTIRTPLFKSRDLYGLDPQYTVTFNDKDMRRYQERYPNIIVVFDVKWEETKKMIDGVAYTVDPMHITVAGFLSDIRRAIKSCGSHKHIYQRRINDNEGNAKESWVFDVRQLHSLEQ